MKSVYELMANSSGDLNRLFQRCQILKRLEKILHASLPVPLNQHCRVANLQNKILVIHTNSSLWATRLRYMAPDLLRQWGQNRTIPAIDQIEIKVRPTIESS